MPDSSELTVEGLKRHVDIERSADDDLLKEFLDAALEQAQARPPWGCGRLLAPSPATDDDDPVTKTLELVGGRLVDVPDARAITAVRVDGELSTAYTTTEQDGHVVRLNLEAIARTVEVTGHFGFLEIPVSLRLAIYQLAARSYYERQANFADQVAVAEGAAVQSYYRQLPPRVKLVFATFAVRSATPAARGGFV